MTRKRAKLGGLLQQILISTQTTLVMIKATQLLERDKLRQLSRKEPSRGPNQSPESLQLEFKEPHLSQGDRLWASKLHQETRSYPMVVENQALGIHLLQGRWVRCKESTGRQSSPQLPSVRATIHQRTHLMERH